MNHFLSLPFDVHLHIARNLSLKDSLTYSSLAPICHDAVYYIFAHRLQLDFSTLIINNTLSLSTDDFLKILHAHTRTRTIRNFCVPNNFTAYTALSLYLQLYWEHTYIPSYDPSDLEPSMICGTHVGHIRGQLSRICYLGFYGAINKHQKQQMYDILHIYDDDTYGVNIIPEDNPTHLLHDDINWSNTDLDAPYTACSNCLLHIEYPPHTHDTSAVTLCWQCSTINDILTTAPTPLNF